jgi:hypothetical protein
MKRYSIRIQPEWSREADELPFAPPIPRALPEIKCVSCGCADAPFGVGYPNHAQWFCRLHIGGTILEDIDKMKMKEVMRRCVKGAQNWLYLYEAAGRGQSAECRRLWEQIRILSVETSDILKALSPEKAEEKAGE